MVRLSPLYYSAALLTRTRVTHPQAFQAAVADSPEGFLAGSVLVADDTSRVLLKIALVLRGGQ